jgi:N-acyl-D-aspartate/D-glutamate deacylase
VRAAGLTEEARQQRELTEALGRVPHEVLLALDELLDAIERGEDPDALVDPYEVADERGRRALDALVDILADPSKNEEPPSAKLPR